MNPTYGTQSPGPLFSLPPASRRDGPVTSRMAELPVKQRVTNATLVKQLVDAHPGMTCKELAATIMADVLGLGYHEIGRRLPDAAKLHYIKRGPARKCEVCGHSCTTWWPMDDE